MYIVNLEGLEAQTYSCNSFIGKWLQDEKSIPVLNIDKDNVWHFSKTPLLEEVLEQLPFILKLFNIF